MIGAVATNAKFTKGQATKVAQMAQDGLAQAKQHAAGQGTAAAKWVAEGQYKEMKAKVVKNPVGRPLKEEEDTSEQDNQKIEKDIGRLGLVMGGKR